MIIGGFFMHISKKITCLFLTIYYIFIPSIFAFSNDSRFVWSSIDSSIITSSTISTSASITSPIPNLNLDCGSAILIEQNAGKVLYEQNSHEQLRPASVTKVMSILLIMEALDSGKISLSDRVPCSKHASSMGRFTNMVRCKRNINC